jgi:hypothetical protein
LATDEGDDLRYSTPREGRTQCKGQCHPMISRSFSGVDTTPNMAPELPDWPEPAPAAGTTLSTLASDLRAPGGSPASSHSWPRLTPSGLACGPGIHGTFCNPLLLICLGGKGSFLSPHFLRSGGLQEPKVPSWSPVTSPHPPWKMPSLSLLSLCWWPGGQEEPGQITGWTHGIPAWHRWGAQRACSQQGPPIMPCL